MNRVWTATLICTVAAATAMGGLKFGQEGLEIQAGGLGEFKIEYPKLFDAAGKEIHKLTAAKPAGQTAVLEFDGGPTMTLTAGADGRVVMAYTKLPGDVKKVMMTMLIPIQFNQGGRWRCGATDGTFPKEKPTTRPQLFQGNETAFRLANHEGASLDITTPEFAYQELTDNREWGWAIYAWRFHAPVNPDKSEMVLTVKAGAGDAAAAKPRIDRFGQLSFEEWPGKMKADDELKADAEREHELYRGGPTPPTDRFGGLPGSGAKLGLKATGFFHLEQRHGRWILVNPDGNAFFHLGVCVFGPGDDYTLVKGRESIYEWIPPFDGDFRTAFRREDGSSVVSFHLANMIRKFGRPYDEDAYYARTIARVRGWGFNSIGAFSGGGHAAREAAQFPYVSSLPIGPWNGIPRLPGAHEVFDPFDEAIRARVEKNLAEALPRDANNPLIIGHFIVNEPIFEDIPKAVAALDMNHACKRKLVDALKAKHGTIDAFNAAWGLSAGSFDDLAATGLAVSTDAARADMKAFAGTFLEAYMHLVSDAYRRHDPNHLLLGCRLQPQTINDEQTCRIIGQHVDVMSFNYYTEAALDTNLLKRIHGWTGGRPLMLSEFFWSSPSDSGLTGGRALKSQKERGLAYRNYVERAAALGIVVGIEWFTLVDQSATGRWFSGFNGEAGNSGLIAVTDRPWTDAVEEMRKTNLGIYPVWFGESPPFVFDDPRFNPPAGRAP
jgi:hypothetical protein